jgi:hypothetical protein
LCQIEPGRKIGSVCADWDQDTAVEADTAGMKPFQSFDGRETGIGVVKGEKFLPF